MRRVDRARVVPHSAMLATPFASIALTREGAAPFVVRGKRPPGPENDRLERLQSVLGVRFEHPSLLEQAITHSSFEGGGPLAGNERLEFLGDAVLKLVIAWHLYSTSPGAPEGDLSSMLGRAVSERSLADAATRLGIGEFLRLGHGLEVSGGRNLPSVLADAFEAILAAVFLDQGLDAALAVAARELGAATGAGVAARDSTNYKAILQEIFQKREKCIPEYRVIGEKGPDHDKTFEIAVGMASGTIGRGVGRTKKEAEQAAARDALERMGVGIVREAGGIQGGELRG